MAAFHPTGRSVDLERDAGRRPTCSRRARRLRPAALDRPDVQDRRRRRQAGPVEHAPLVPDRRAVQPVRSTSTTASASASRSTRPTRPTDFGETRIGCLVLAAGRARHRLAPDRARPGAPAPAGRRRDGDRWGRTSCSWTRPRTTGRGPRRGRPSQVRDDLLAVARERAAFVARRVRAGEVPPVDSVEARLAVISREGDRVSALRAAESAGVDAGDVPLGRQSGEPAPLRARPRRRCRRCRRCRGRDRRASSGRRAGRRPEVAGRGSRAEARAWIEPGSPGSSSCPTCGSASRRSRSATRPPASTTSTSASRCAAAGVPARPGAHRRARRWTSSRRDFDQDVVARAGRPPTSRTRSSRSAPRRRPGRASPSSRRRWPRRCAAPRCAASSWATGRCSSSTSASRPGLGTAARDRGPRRLPTGRRRLPLGDGPDQT